MRIVILHIGKEWKNMNIMGMKMIMLHTYQLEIESWKLCEIPLLKRWREDFDFHTRSSCEEGFVSVVC
ncbi:hypothetical protein Bca52824_075616 [Brassica carinata]|uniref:Uncharacterized protein n=1 Tax=Brassica carinata TaxID=52824 RepID=A0A8X7TVW5_BRACI|nr:hypothetical protein Bca52824_075616 [Brassica carinata]